MFTFPNKFNYFIIEHLLQLYKLNKMKLIKFCLFSGEPETPRSNWLAGKRKHATIVLLILILPAVGVSTLSTVYGITEIAFKIAENFDKVLYYYIFKAINLASMMLLAGILTSVILLSKKSLPMRVSESIQYACVYF